MQNNSITSQTDIANVTVVTEENQIIVPQPITSVIEVNNPGPQGPVGPTGPQGPSVPFSNIGGDVYATTSSLQVTGSFLVSGSSTFTNIGPAIFSGSTSLVGATTMSSALVTGNVTVLGTASIGTLVVNQTVLSTGSNQLGDNANDTQTLYGSVIIPTGSLTVTGSINVKGTTNGTSSLSMYGDLGSTLRLNVGSSNPNKLQFTQEFTPGTPTEIGFIQNEWGTGTTLSTFQDIIFKPGNIERARFANSTGNFLIGTTIDSIYKFDVNGTARIKGPSLTSDALFVQNSNGTNMLNFGAGSVNGGLPSISSPQGSIYIYPNTASLANTFIFQTDGLHLAPGTSNVWGEGNQNRIDFSQAGGGHLRVITTGTNDALFLTGGTERMRISSSGNVGIGTSSPLTLLHVQGNYAGALDNLIPQLRFQNANITSNSDIYAVAKVLTGTGYTGGYPELWMQAYRNASNVGSVSIRVVSNHPLTFNTNDVERMRLFANGNLAIGTTTDSGYKLDVRGEAIISSSLTLDSQPIFRVASGLAVNVLDVRGNGNMVLGGSSDVGIGTGLGVFTRYSLRVGSLSYTDASAILQADSTTRGFLPPRTSATSLISSPAQGLITYVTGANDGLYYYNSGSQPGWHEVLTNTGSQSITGSLEVRVNSATSTNNALRLSNTQGNAGIGTGLVFYSDTTPSQGVFNTGRIYSDFPGFLYTDARMIFQTPTADSTWTDTLTLKGSSVGIGTTSPAFRLEVQGGDVRFANALTIGTGGGTGFTFSSNTITSIQNTFFAVDVVGSNRHFNITNSSTSTYYFRVAPTTGNIIIGGTVDAGAKLNVRGSGSSYTSKVILAQNSSSGDVFEVRDDGAVKIGSGSYGHPVLTRFQINDMTGATVLRVDPSATYTNGTISNNGVESLTVNGNPSLLLRVGNANNGNVTIGNNTNTVAYTSNSTSFVVTNQNWFAFSGSSNQTVNLLHVSNSVNFVSSSGTNIARGVYIAPSLTGVSDFRAIETTSGSVLFGASGTGFYWDNTNNRLGIGTSSPLVGLHISKATDSSIYLQDSDATSTFNITELGNSSGNFQLTTRNSAGGFVSTDYAITKGASGASQHDWLITQQNAMRLTFNKNLLIGTTTDAGYALDVSGSAGSTARFRGSAGQSTVSLNDGTNDNIIVGLSGRLQLRPSGNTTFTALATGEIGIGTITPAYKLDVSGSARFKFTPSGADLFTIDGATTTRYFIVENSNGFVGIGNGYTTSATPATSVDIRGNTSIRGGSATVGNAFIVTNTTPTTLLTIQNNGQVAFTSPTMSLAASQSAFSISPIISASNIVGGQYYGVSITPTFFQTTGSQTETAFRVAATFTSSNATATSGSNIIADFGSTSAGSQLTVTDVTSGSIYMVNDVSGIPIIEATSNWDVNMYDFPNKVFEKTGSQVNIYGTMRVSGSFILPLSQSATPQTGSAYWSGSLLFIYNGTRYMSASFA